MIYLTKRVEFAAAHRLTVESGSASESERLFGACGRPGGHGHNYLLEVTVAGRPDPQTGMLLDLKTLKAILEERVVGILDHTLMDRGTPMLRGRNPTAENLAMAIWEQLADRFPAGRLHEIKLWETENNCATYRGEADIHAGHTE